MLVSVAMELARGNVVAGRYRLERMLGQGGMGTVWAATHTVTRRKVALKLMRGLGAEDPALRKRFLREARAASLVDHPNVVRIHDVFELDDGTPMMVMELLEGETLRALLEREGVLGVEHAARLLLPVVSAVGVAHEHGVVHRDLKPENVILTPGGIPKVLDFGVAKLHGDEGATMTAAGTVLGTPCYMAPEQGFGEPDVDQRADVWAVGVMLYEALSGGRPIEGENLGQVLKRLMDDGIAPLTAVAPDVPSDVAELVARMLVRDRAERMLDLRDAAEVLAEHTDASVPEFGPPGSRAHDEHEAEASATLATATKHEDTASPHALPAEGSESRRAVVLGALLVAAVGAAFWLLRTGKSGAAEPKPATSMAPASPPAVSREFGVELPAPSTLEANSPPEPAKRLASKPRMATPSAAPAVSVPAVPPPSAPAPAPKPTPKGGLVEEPPF